MAPAANGVDFLGYIVRRDYLLVRRRVVGHLRERLRDFEQRLVTAVEGGLRYAFDWPVLDELAAVLASYLGHFKVAAAWRLWAGLRRRFPFLAQYFAFDPVGLRLVRTYPVPAGFLRAREQYAWFRRRYPADVLFFQVGGFCEFYAGEDRAVASELGLRPMGRNRRGAAFGFPCTRTEEFLRQLRDRQRPVLLIGETPVAHARIRARVPVARYARSGSSAG